ncbi:hypothetical protein P389DRAFT_210395 [Cystobasidium minutum MCA 4210]|uniref:uncharacterized protein n=1 Tax=Cystobasidium minutum MCA 4210 TaxID=1397322 RepID=UPI0034CFB762|eukprot:jgi/Rhomi1/210395/estExt_Genemark1.C_3_t30158
MSVPDTKSVQMYYVSEGVPVGLASSQKQEDTGSSTSRLPNGGNEHTIYNYKSSSVNQREGQEVKRADSLESLLSLNVLAAQLLTDHDDLQAVSPVSSRNNHWGQGQSPNLSESYGGTPTSSHTRFHSYSTVSTRAPSTPPSDSNYAKCMVNSGSPVTGKEVQEDAGYENGNSEDRPATREKLAPGDINPLRSGIDRSTEQAAQGQLGSNVKALSSKRQGSGPPRIASMVISNAIADRLVLEEGDPATIGREDYLQGAKTPLPEPGPSLPASSSGHTIRPEEVSTRHNRHTPVHSHLNRDESLDLHFSQTDRKGKGRAVDQDADLASPAINDTSYDDLASANYSPRPVQHSSTSASLASEQGSGLAQSSTPTSPTGKKISDLLKEQYEIRQRSGTLGSPSSRATQSPSKPRRSDTATSNGDAASLQSLSPGGRAPISLSSRHIRTSSFKSDAQAERAQLLHSIISQDFAGAPNTVTGGFISEPSKELPWNPTEYVGPPRRRSISGTSILALGRKGQANPRGPSSHRRQNSADLLTTRTNTTSAEEVDGPQRLGIRKAYAASADDLLTRKMSIQKRSESTLPAHNGFTASKGKIFSIKRKTPPVSNGVNKPILPATRTPPEAPFRSMIDTSTLPSQPRTAGSSLGHKRSLSGSIHSMLSTFGSSSHLRRKRNASAPDGTEPTQYQTSQSLSSASAINQPPPPSEFGSYPRQEKLSNSASRSANGRQSPFKMWRYPSDRNDDPGRQGSPANGPANSVHITQTRIAAVSSPTSSEDLNGRPQSPFFRGQSRFEGSSKALSSADTIAEDDGEDENMLDASDDEQEEEDEETRRLKGLASQQVLRDSENRARVVEKFKDGERSASSLGLYSTTAA